MATVSVTGTCCAFSPMAPAAKPTSVWVLPVISPASRTVLNVLFFHLADLDQMGERLRDLRGKRREPPLNGFFHESLRKKAGDSHPQPGIEIPGGVEKIGDVSVGSGLDLSIGTSDRRYRRIRSCSLSRRTASF